MNLDYTLQGYSPANLTDESSTEQKTAFKKLEHSNRTSLMIMKGSTATAIHRAISDSENVKIYLTHIEEQFQGSSKALTTHLITKIVMFKYSGSSGVREHILRMNDITSQLKSLDMKIFEDFKDLGYGFKTNVILQHRIIRLD
ncbi:hypothetical protein RJ640_010799 [Escallonia rubra]|uniref:UBN2_2 domain-containing protein n=1 Tax=Escallonia rubra TaxID=112253 RepID=A0AA88S235_9ASTE|nr:hypothetical protein RJ640_010799 [Escallonia rubra]